MYATRGTSRPGRMDIETIAAPVEQSETERVPKTHLARAQNIGKLSRILSVHGPQTIAELARQTGLNRGAIYVMLKEFEGDLFGIVEESTGHGMKGVAWKWLLSWKHAA